MKKENNNSYWQWGIGIGLLGFFFLFLYEPPPDHVTFQCDRAKGICTVKKSGFFRTTTQQIRIEDIRYAHSEKFGSFIRGYNGPEIKLQDGNDVSIGAGKSMPSKEQKTVDEINTFLLKTDMNQLYITQKSFPTFIVALAFLFGGFYLIYKALQPCIRHGIGNQNE